MMIHLDFLVEDLAAAVGRVTDLGGTLADYQPQEHVRVCADPEGHVFCLFHRIVAATWAGFCRAER